MTTTQSAEPWWQVPRRPREGRIVAGVASGIAAELGVEPMVIRAVLVVLTIAGGWGVLLYLTLWLWSSMAGSATESTNRPKGRSEHHRHAAIGLFTLGVLLLIDRLRLGFADTLVWPTAALALGYLIVWRRSQADAGGPGSTGGKLKRWTGVRIMAGLGMAAGGVTALLALNFNLSDARNVLLGSIVVLAGLALIVGPWIHRMINDLTRERRLRIRSEERTEVAAHLHDSVLQTLALIQRNADDSQAMVQLARRQERELRDWLYGGGGATEATLRRAIIDLATEVEELHGLPVEVVVVGDFDRDIDESTSALLGATREAVVNAAKHSGASKIDLYAEATDDRIDVFVRDTGSGFEIDAIAEDRRGITESIRGRMSRIGGSCDISSAIGDGTEVELHLPVKPEGATT